MSGSVSAYLRDLLLASVFTREQAELLDEVWIALTETVAPANASGNQLTEPKAGGYERVLYPMNIEHWELDGSGTVRSTKEIVFNEPLEDWPMVTGYAVVTTATSGVTLTSGTLITPATFSPGMVPVIGAGGISVVLRD